jgi:large conductance mechanosensitive channel
MKKLFKEFAAFINKGNALALAIGVIIGGAFTAIVSTINTKIISPVIGYFLGGYNLAESEALKTVLKPEVLNEAGEVISAENAIYWGALIQAVIDFLLTAIVLFAIFKIVTFAIESAKKSAEKLEEKMKELIHKEEETEEVVAEEVVVEEPVVVEEVKPSEEVLLLTEIRDLLSKRNNTEE